MLSDLLVRLRDRRSRSVDLTKVHDGDVLYN